MPLRSKCLTTRVEEERECIKSPKGTLKSTFPMQADGQLQPSDCLDNLLGYAEADEGHPVCNVCFLNFISTKCPLSPEAWHCIS